MKNDKNFKIYLDSSSSFPSLISTPTKIANKTMKKPIIDFHKPMCAADSGV